MPEPVQLIPFKKTHRLSKLTVGEAFFLEAVLSRRMTATDAYLEFIAKPGCERSTAGNAASVVLRRQHIREYIRELRDHALSATRATIDRLTAGVCSIAMADRMAMFNPDWSLKPLADWPKDLRDAVDSIELEEIVGTIIDKETGEKIRGVVGRKLKVRCGGSRLQALELLMRFKGMVGPNITEDPEARKDNSLIVEVVKKPKAAPESEP